MGKNTITKIMITIEVLRKLALEKTPQELGAFHRELAIELGRGEPKGDTEASKLAIELLENARANSDRKK